MDVIKREKKEKKEEKEIDYENHYNIFLMYNFLLQKNKKEKQS